MEKKKERTSTNWRPLIFIAVILLGYIFLSHDVENKDTSSGNATESQQSKPSAKSLMPAQEVKFVEAIERSRTSAESAKNDMQVGGIKSIRDKEICAIVPEDFIIGWVGTVKTVSSNSDGKGVFSVEIAKGVEIKTWNNDLSDTMYGTLFSPDSDIFSVASKLDPGDTVKFSGSFFRDPNSCLDEGSLTLDGKVRSPEFIFKFSNLQKM